MADSERMYTVEEAATELGIHKMTLYTQVRKGLFKGAVNVEKDASLRPKWRIPETALHRGKVQQERRTAVKEKRAPEEFLMPDSDTKVKIIRMIRERFPVDPRDKEARYGKHNIVMFSSELTHGPDFAYLGATAREAAYVVEIDHLGEIHDIHMLNKHPLHPVASEAAMLAWKKEATKWQDHYERLARRVMSILPREDPTRLQLEENLQHLITRRAQIRMLNEVILEVVQC